MPSHWLIITLKCTALMMNLNTELEKMTNFLLITFYFIYRAQIFTIISIIYSEHLTFIGQTGRRILDIGENKEFHRMDAQIACASADTKWSISSEHSDF